MQYRLPKRHFFAILLAGGFFAAAISFYILAGQPASWALAMPYAATVMLAAGLYVVGRFLVFGTLYHLGDDYSDLTFTVFRVYQKTSSPIARFALDGSEELIAYDRRGRKQLKKRKKIGVYTANLIPQGYYAMTCQRDGEDCFILLELDATAKDALKARIDRARKIASFDQDPKEEL